VTLQARVAEPPATGRLFGVAVKVMMVGLLPPPPLPPPLGHPVKAATARSANACLLSSAIRVSVREWGFLERSIPGTRALRPDLEDRWGWKGARFPLQRRACNHLGCRTTAEAEALAMGPGRRRTGKNRPAPTTERGWRSKKNVKECHFSPGCRPSGREQGLESRRGRTEPLTRSGGPNPRSGTQRTQWASDERGQSLGASPGRRPATRASPAWGRRSQT
jgi:hypothetical protein